MKWRIFGVLVMVIGLVVCSFASFYVVGWLTYQTATGASVGFGVSLPYVAVLVVGILIVIGGLILLRLRGDPETA